MEENSPQENKLYVISTPIGNLSDLTLRARSTIEKVDFLVAEDTRVSSKILQYLNLKKPILKYNEHSQKNESQKILGRLKRGESGALLSDAGAPGVSDPGPRLIEELRLANIKVIPIPGPSAPICLWSVAGFGGDKFAFWGFIPKKKGREKFLKALRESPIPIIFFESPHRFKKLIDILPKFLEPERDVVVGREMTKKFEEIKKMKIKDLKTYFSKNIKGEITVIIDGVKASSPINHATQNNDRRF